MAKHVVKHKDKAIEQKIHPSRIGFLAEGVEITLDYNKGTDRYDLKVDGQLNLSSSHQMCLHRAAGEGVIWG